MTSRDDEKTKRQIQAAKQVMDKYDSALKKLAKSPIDHGDAATNSPPKRPVSRPK